MLKSTKFHQAVLIVKKVLTIQKVLFDLLTKLENNDENNESEEKINYDNSGKTHESQSKSFKNMINTFFGKEYAKLTINLDIKDKEAQPYSIEEQMSMKIDHGMSFFSKRDAFLRATDLGIKLEYIDEEPSEELSEEKKVKTEDGKVINLKAEPFKELGPDGLNDANEESKDSINPFDKVKREYTVNGFKVSKTPLANDDEIAVLVSDPQWTAEGFLKSKYVTYQMKTPSMGYDVRRKDKDFVLFQEYLNKVYPHILVPVIPEVQKDRKSSNKYWERRGKELQTFMNKLLQSEDLKT
jgi:hypothetical protein